MSTEPASPATKRTKVRYLIVLILFLLTAINYADRATLSIVGTDLSKALKLDTVWMGYVFSAFAWAYVIGQIPGGWLLDRMGSRRVYGWSIGLWSLFTLLQGFIGGLDGRVAVMVLFGLRFLLGAAEAPSFPANARIVASWFPTAERGTASAIFNSAQYFATVLFAPIMGWITHTYGWEHVFWFMGALGIMFALAWPRIMHSPREHPWVNRAELEHIGARRRIGRPRCRWQAGGERGRALGSNRATFAQPDAGWHLSRSILHHDADLVLSDLVPHLLGQGARHVDPAGRLCRRVARALRICWWHPGRMVLGPAAEAGVLAHGGAQNADRRRLAPVGHHGGVQLRAVRGCGHFSHEPRLFRQRRWRARLGGHLRHLGPSRSPGCAAGCSTPSATPRGIVTPIAIGYILKATGSFNWALVYVSAHAALAVACYTILVGEIKRVELKVG